MTDNKKEVIAGVDVGNATTEIAIAVVSEDGEVEFLTSGIIPTTGIKGTTENIKGIRMLLERLTHSYPETVVKKILLNDATPVIADFAMDTITETVITDSAMIGHNPDTPGGIGLGFGYTALIDSVPEDDEDHIVVVPESVGFSEAAEKINDLIENGISIKGAILKNDEGTLVNNRLKAPIPIVDEVEGIGKIPLGMPCAVEVAAQGHGVDILSNPYGLASLFSLTPGETENSRYVAKALIGNRSAVVIKTPESDIEKRTIPAGSVEFIGDRYSEKVDIEQGAEKIMAAEARVSNIIDVTGEHGTNVGGMFERLKNNMSDKCMLNAEEIKVSDVFAVDSYTAVSVKGGLANEYAMESGVAIAAMVRTDNRFMSIVADKLKEELHIPVVIGGIEGEMAWLGVLTTPGTEPPMIMVDIGAGSTDAAYMDKNGSIKTVHLAGAGNLITMLIDSELHLESFSTAEMIKKFPLAKVDNLYRIRHEDGTVSFREEPLPAHFFGQIVTVSPEGELNVIETKSSMDKIRHVRRSTKRKVMVSNVLRAINEVQDDNDKARRVVFIGGSALDFEMGNILTEEMDRYKYTAGKGNIRGVEGPRNAVATGLILKYAREVRLTHER